MPPVGLGLQQPPAPSKAKRSISATVQVNGDALPKSSPSPSLPSNKPPLNIKATPNSASDRTVTPSTVRPVNRNRRETSLHNAGRSSRNSAGLRSGSFSAAAAAQDEGSLPYGSGFSYDLLDAPLLLTLLSCHGFLYT